MDTDVRDATEVWIAFRRLPLMADGKACPGCGMSAVHEMLGIGVSSGNQSAEDMAKRFCNEVQDFIGRLPVNTLFPDNPLNLPGAYYPLTGKLVFPVQGQPTEGEKG